MYSGRDIQDQFWHYTGQPQTVPRDEVRLLVGDINPKDKLLTDGEILYALARTTNVYAAAARCAEALAALWSRDVDRSIDDVQSIRLSQRADAMRSLAVQLADKAASISAIPFAGGISRSDMDARDADQDQIPTLFTAARFMSAESTV